MCIGKRFAELELQMLVIEMLKKFKIEWAGEGELGAKLRLTNIPDREIKFKFTRV